MTYPIFRPTIHSKGKVRVCHTWYMRVPKAIDPRKKISTQETTKERAEAFARRWAKEHKPKAVFEHDAATMTDHLDAFEQMLKDKGTSDEWAYAKKARVRKTIAGCRWTYLTDLDVYKAAEWLHKQVGVWRKRQAAVKAAKAAKKKPPVGLPCGLSPQTRNHFYEALKHFGAWLKATGRTTTNPFNREDATVRQVLRKRPLKHKELSFQRRHLTPEEMEKLLAATRKKTRQGMSGKDRAMCYLVASLTGLRRKELASLTPESFRLDDAFVLLAGQFTKNGNDASQPIRSDLMAELRPWLAKKRKGQRVFPGLATLRTTELMQCDLKAAGIERETDDGKVDFHSLRYTFAATLALSDVAEATRKELMRHESEGLTDLYSRLNRKEKRDAVESTRPRCSAPESNAS